MIPVDHLPLTAGVATTLSQQLVRKLSHSLNFFPANIPPPLFIRPPSDLHKNRHFSDSSPRDNGKERKNNQRFRCFSSIVWVLYVGHFFTFAHPDLYPLNHPPYNSRELGRWPRRTSDRSWPAASPTIPHDQLQRQNHQTATLRLSWCHGGLIGLSAALLFYSYLPDRSDGCDYQSFS